MRNWPTISQITFFARNERADISLISRLNHIIHGNEKQLGDLPGISIESGIMNQAA